MQLAAAEYKFYVMLNSYNNSNSQALGGDDRRNCEPSCSLNCECDNQFSFCLRSYGSSRSDVDATNCPLGGNLTTKIYMNMDIFDFGTSLGTTDNPIPNPILFDGESWPVIYTDNKLAGCITYYLVVYP